MYAGFAPRPKQPASAATNVSTFSSLKYVQPSFVFASIKDCNSMCKIYSGSSGYTVAGRVDNGKVYSGSSGYTVVARFDGQKVYSGSSGYNVLARVDGQKIYAGSSGYSVLGRIDGQKVYMGSSGYTVAGRSEGCGGMSFAAGAAALVL